MVDLRSWFYLKPPAWAGKNICLHSLAKVGTRSPSKAFSSACQPRPLQDGLAEIQVYDGTETSLLSALRFHCLQQRRTWELTCLQVTRIRDKCHMKSQGRNMGSTDLFTWPLEEPRRPLTVLDDGWWTLEKLIPTFSPSHILPCPEVFASARV